MIAWLRDSPRTSLAVDYVQRITPDLQAVAIPVDGPASVDQARARESLCAVIIPQEDTKRSPRQ